MKYNLVKEIERDIDDLKDKLRPALKLQELLEALVLPEGLTIKEYISGLPEIYDHGAYADVTLHLEAEDFRTGYDALMSLGLLPVELRRDGCAWFCPAQLPTKQGREPTKTPVGPIQYTVDGLRQYPDSKYLEAFYELNGVVLELNVYIKDDPDIIRSYSYYKYMGGYRVDNTRLTCTHDEFNDHIIWGRGSSDHPARVTAYFKEKPCL